MSDAAALIEDLTRPLASREGLDLLSVSVRGRGPRTLVRVIVDRKGGITLEDCATLSRRLSEALDRADPLRHRYALEVTSPGTDYPLRDQAAFARVEGRQVRVHHRTAADRVAQLEGAVVAADPDRVLLDVAGRTVGVAYGDIVKATQRLPW